MTISCAVWVPGEPLTFRDDLQWQQVEALAGGQHGALARVSLFRDGKAGRLLKLLASDVSGLFPDAYGRHDEAATGFVAGLGGPVQTWWGVLVVYGIDSLEGGFPWPLSTAQRAWIADAYRAATGSEPVGANQV